MAAPRADLSRRKEGKVHVYKPGGGDGGLRALSRGLPFDSFLEFGRFNLEARGSGAPLSVCRILRIRNSDPYSSSGIFLHLHQGRTVGLCKFPGA